MNDSFHCNRGAGLAEFVIVMSMVAIGSLGTISLFGDDLRALFSASDNALAGDEVATPATRAAEGMLSKNLKNFANNHLARDHGFDRLAMNRALQNALAWGRRNKKQHWDNQFPPSELNPDFMVKVAANNGRDDSRRQHGQALDTLEGPDQLAFVLRDARWLYPDEEVSAYLSVVERKGEKYLHLRMVEPEVASCLMSKDGQILLTTGSNVTDSDWRRLALGAIQISRRQQEQNDEWLKPYGLDDGIFQDLIGSWASAFALQLEAPKIAALLYTLTWVNIGRQANNRLLKKHLHTQVPTGLDHKIIRERMRHNDPTPPLPNRRLYW